jgi:hypothetical protein
MGSKEKRAVECRCPHLRGRLGQAFACVLYASGRKKFRFSRSGVVQAMYEVWCGAFVTAKPVF